MIVIRRMRIIVIMFIMMVGGCDGVWDIWLVDVELVFFCGICRFSLLLVVLFVFLFVFWVVVCW